MAKKSSPRPKPGLPPQQKWLMDHPAWPEVQPSGRLGPDTGEVFVYPSGKTIEHTRDAILGDTKGAIVVRKK